MNQFIGAAIAALILFLSSMVTLFVNDPTLEFEAIATATWVSVVGGAAVAFLKDFQAISTRRLINAMTKTGDGGGQI